MDLAGGFRHMLRRVITGHDAHGRSIIVFDDKPHEPFAGDFEFWSTGPDVGPIAAAGDQAQRPARLLPQNGGTLFRFITIPPDHMVKALFDGNNAFDAYAAGVEHLEDAEHRFKHRTATVDYIVVLQGQVDLVLDGVRTTLKPFNALVQRATAHAWANPYDEPALLAVVLVDAR